MQRLARPILLASAGLLALSSAALGASGIPGQTAAAATSTVTARSTVATSSWTVYHYWPSGTGVAPAARAVNTSRRAWTSPRLDGQLYGEPLVFGKYVYVATQNNTVYALVARTGKVAWSRHLGTPVPASALPCTGISPTVGITGTPVIDLKRGEIFVVADLYVKRKPGHHLFGLSTTSGKVELSEDVDPPGSYPPALLQHTALNLDEGQVIFGMGGNNGDCSTYRGRVVAVPEKGGKPKFFTVDAAPGDSQGAIWMGGAAPVVDGKGHIWVATGNGSVESPGRAYDDSDGLLELSSSLKLLQYFAPTTWRQNNANDFDMSAAPALLSNGQVIFGGKSRIVYLLNASHLGGIGGQVTSLGGGKNVLLGSACSGDIDGGVAVSGTTAYLPCFQAAVIAVQATKSRLRLLWTQPAGSGPPIIVAGLIWTIAGGYLHGLSPRNGSIVQQFDIGQSANDFPTPSVGDGLMLCPVTTTVVAFAVSAPK
jgi:outer membrane protein assembly factor BamB